jgi:hypothetical protein
MGGIEIEERNGEKKEKRGNNVFYVRYGEIPLT